MKIFINPGHEPSLEPGACANGLREADITLAIGGLVEDYLLAAGYETRFFQFDGLGEICDAANYWNADLFVSIHCNADENPDACGTETFYIYGSTAGFELAKRIHNQIVANIPVVDRGVKDENFAVLRGTNCPAVLVETAFITNFYDAELLRNLQDDFARAIARGITDFLCDCPLPDVLEH